MEQGRGGYWPTASTVVYECDATSEFTRADWIALAVAALDQAGVTPAQFAEATRLAESAGHTDQIVAELIDT